ncbi:hypothetical protein DPQ22_05435 [Candidatus Tokpelaia sp.]|nr:hypothetical protein DPQ22_05435 [Candidatus Tokpelaia sp.]
MARLCRNRSAQSSCLRQSRLTRCHDSRQGRGCLNFAIGVTQAGEILSLMPILPAASISRPCHYFTCIC